jgi:predicted nucleotidyltransferase component of viral defense system
MAIKKRLLAAKEQQLLREILQTATLAALMDARRWQPGDLAFQGGTSLHLAYGSVRFSEDLDFLVRGGLSLAGLAKQVQNKLRLPPDIAADLRVSVSPSKDLRNPHMFVVTLSGPQVLGSAKVKLELWQTQPDSLKGLAIKVSTLRSAAGQAFVPTLSLDEIFVDKVYALGARARVKPRDVFDLWWLSEKAFFTLTAQALRNRLTIYPVASGVLADTAAAWLTNAALRLQDLQAQGAAAWLAADLKRWLPSFWQMDEAQAARMLAVSTANLQNGIQQMQTLQSTLIAADSTKEPQA